MTKTNNKATIFYGSWVLPAPECAPEYFSQLTKRQAGNNDVKIMKFGPATEDHFIIVLCTVNTLSPAEGIVSFEPELKPEAEWKPAIDEFCARHNISHGNLGWYWVIENWIE